MEAGFIDIICALQLSDHWLHDNLKRLDLVVANDQLNKGIRYVKGGHLDTATLDVRRVRHEVHGKLLIAAVVVASRKTNQYRRRVCFTLAEDGRVLTWLPPPFSQCACVIHRYVCAHQLALVCMLSFIAVLVARVRAGADAPVAEGDDVDVDVDVDVDQKEDVDAAAAAATAAGVEGGGGGAAGGGDAGAAPTGAVTLADVALLLPEPVMPLSQQCLSCCGTCSPLWFRASSQP